MNNATGTHPNGRRTIRRHRHTIHAMRLGVVLAACAAAVLVSSTNANASPSSRDTAILNTAPAYYYPLATNAADATGHGNPALTTTDVWNHTGGTVTYTGTAASFDGEAFLSDGPAPASTDAAVGAWFTVPKSFPGARTILSADGWQIDVGQGWLAWSPLSGAGFTVNVTSGGEHQVIASYHAGTVTLYVDGQKVGTHAAAPITPAALSVGSMPGQADYNAIQGTVSNVAGWTTALTATQVASMWTAGATPFKFHRWAMLRHVGR